MPKKRKTRKDSTTAKVKAAQDDGAVIPLPEAVKLDDGDEMILWRQFTQARPPENWRDFDLILIAKMVRLESRIRKHDAIIDSTSAIVENRRGTMIENPLIRVVDTLTRQQLSIVRSLSLGVQSNQAIAQNNNGKPSNNKKDLKTIRGGNVVDLLA